jgi:hypothetical protein
MMQYLGLLHNNSFASIIGAFILVKGIAITLPLPFITKA